MGVAQRGDVCTGCRNRKTEKGITHDGSCIIGCWVHRAIRGASGKSWMEMGWSRTCARGSSYGSCMGHVWVMDVYGSNFSYQPPDSPWSSGSW